MGQRSISNWATAISAGPAGESGPPESGGREDLSDVFALLALDLAEQAKRRRG